MDVIATPLGTAYSARAAASLRDLSGKRLIVLELYALELHFLELWRTVEMFGGWTHDAGGPL